MNTPVAALFVDEHGVYSGRDDVDRWGESRDARLYSGPCPVVAHPPCSRWCRLAKLVQARWGHRVGDDGGLEHPAWSLAWSAFGIARPASFGWSMTMEGDWVCEVAQSAYGHQATKLTWLLYVGTNPPPPLDWSKPRGTKVVGHMSRRGDGSIWRRNVDRITKRARDMLGAMQLATACMHDESITLEPTVEFTRMRHELAVIVVELEALIARHPNYLGETPKGDAT